MDSSNKITVTIADLPKYAINNSWTKPTKELKNVFTDFDLFLVGVRTALQQTMLNAQKNRLYRITLWVGNLEKGAEHSLGSAPFQDIMKLQDHLQYIQNKTDGTASDNVQ
jgi:hypothetical protein